MKFSLLNYIGVVTVLLLALNFYDCTHTGREFFSILTGVVVLLILVISAVDFQFRQIEK